MQFLCYIKPILYISAMKMNVLQRLRRATKAFRDGDSASSESVISAYGSGMHFINVRGSYYMSLSAVYRAVSVIASSVAQLPIEVYDTDKGGYITPSVSDPIRGWLRRGGDIRMTRYTLIEQLVKDMLLFGNGYALIRRRGRQPIGLHYVRPQRVSILASANDEEIAYEVADEGRIAPSDIIHLINISDDGIKGISTLDYAANTLGTALSAEEVAKGFFEGGGRHSGFITTTAGTRLNKTQRDEIAELVDSKGKPGGVFVLEGGFDFHAMGINAADAQLLESRLYSVSEIARFFGVSPVKLFDLSNSSYSTVEATQLAFLTDTLSPLMAKIEGELERKLYPTNPEKDINFATDDLLRADKATQAACLQNLVTNGVISPNEARKQLGLPPVDGGDSVKMQINMTNLNQIGQNTSSNEEGN